MGCSRSSVDIRIKAGNLRMHAEFNRHEASEIRCYPRLTGAEKLLLEAAVR